MQRDSCATARPLFPQLAARAPARHLRGGAVAADQAHRAGGGAGHREPPRSPGPRDAKRPPA